MVVVGLFVIGVLATSLVATLFLLGFRLGGDHWARELTNVRTEAARAERAMHDLTRHAFTAMIEHASRRDSE